jgi:hypothetical protein
MAEEELRERKNNFELMKQRSRQGGLQRRSLHLA